MIDEDKIEIKILLQQMLTLLPKRKKVISYIECFFCKKKNLYSNKCI